MCTHNIGFYEDSTKIIFDLSSNMHLISSADMQCEPAAMALTRLRGGSLVSFHWIRTYEPRCEKTGLRSFLPGPTKTRLYSHRRWLEA